MDEKRKATRESPYYFLRVFDTGKHQFSGRVVNLTPEGMTLYAEDPIVKDCLIKFRMTLPETIHDRKQMTFLAKSVWCKENDDPGYYLCGFQFEELSKRNLETIQQLCLSNAQ